MTMNNMNSWNLIAVILCWIVSEHRVILLQCIPYQASEFISMSKDGNYLTDTTINGTVTGSTSQTVVVGEGLVLTGNDNVELFGSAISRTNCFHNPGLCTQGFTLNIIVNFDYNSVAALTLLSSGADVANSYGTALIYSGSGTKQLTAQVSTYNSVSLQKLQWESSVTIPSTQNYFVTITFDGSTLYLYVLYIDTSNIIQVLSDSTNSTTSSSMHVGFDGYYIGKSNGINTYGPGKYDDVLFWTDVKSVNYMNSILTSQNSSLCTPSCTPNEGSNKFLSCYACNLFWDCSKKEIFTCMSGFVFNDITKQCEATSPTCPSNLILAVGNNTLDCFPQPCASGPCQNNGTCVTMSDGWLCQCNVSAEGWTGNQCEQNIDECQTSLNKCVWNNTDSCVDGVGGLNNFTCNCKAGYNLTDCSNYDNCLTSPCQNGATCTDDVTADNYTCTCVPGYVDKNCSTDFNECSSNPCQYGGVCNNYVNFYNCTCPPGYSGYNCQYYDDCFNNPCVNGSCSDPTNTTFNDYVCTCQTGFSDKNCSTENECITQNVTCLNGATCQDLVGAWQCNCVPGYDGLYCGNNINECGPSPCENGATCTDLINDYNCTCLPGYVDKNCSTNFDECTSSPCQNSATCTDLVNSYNCTCTMGYSGTHCELYDECTASPCLNQATCTDSNLSISDSYGCNCASGFYGRNCQNDNGCTSKSVNCQNGGNCVNTTMTGNYTCQCVLGYNGTHCENNIDECASSPCQNGGTCNDLVNMYNCSCLLQYYGTHCESFNECHAAPCQNGATCQDLVNDYSCTCAGNYTGKNCTQCQNGFSDPGCSIENECITQNIDCSSKGVCVDLVGAYQCNCSAGYTGQLCQTNIQECASSPCGVGGSCLDGVNEFLCNCNQNFQGTLCNTCTFGYKGTYCNITDECVIHTPCQNGGNCTDLDMDYSCSCTTGFSGKNCTVENKCITQNVTCLNGGTCSSTDGSCQCTTNYVGSTCQNDNPCYPNPCQNTGTCTVLSGIGAHNCSCPSGYSGNNCENTPCTGITCQNNGTCVVKSGQKLCACETGYSGELCHLVVNTSPSAGASTGDAGSWKPATIALIVILIIIIAVVVVAAVVIGYKYKHRQNKVSPEDGEAPLEEEEEEDPIAPFMNGNAHGDDWEGREVEFKPSNETAGATFDGGDGTIIHASANGTDGAIIATSGGGEAAGPNHNTIGKTRHLDGPVVGGFTTPPPTYDGPTPVES